ncbi:MAG: RDD family protein [Deltaproteobacteria bacterium]|nr:RDD family protein [Deltaproteobacteria bacterium]
MEVSETVLNTANESSPEPSHRLYRIATLQERFASFCVDLIINLYLIGGWGLFLSHLIRKPAFHFEGNYRTFFITSSLAIYFLYHLFFEGAFTATPGKFLGGLIVHKKGGGLPSLLGVFLRNFFRIIDYPLFFLTGVGMMEFTRRCRRLGDIVGRTVVLRKFPSREGFRTDEMVSGSATVRTIAFLIDTIFIALLYYGYLLVIPVKDPMVSALLLNLTPLVLLLYLTLAEAIFSATIGKVIFGFRVIHEDGSRPSFAMIIVRNLFRITDLNPIGYLSALLSSRKQRPGDIAAGTRVIRAKRRPGSWLVIPYMLLLPATVGFLGFLQPHNLLREERRIEFGKYYMEPVPLEIRRYFFDSIHIEQLRLGNDESRPSRTNRFDRGKIIFIQMQVSGFFVQEEKIWVQTDLKVRDPRRHIVLDRANLINTSVKLYGKKSVPLVARFALNPEAMPGSYEVEITVRDRFAKTKASRSARFEVYFKGQGA